MVMIEEGHLVGCRLLLYDSCRGCERSCVRCLRHVVCWRAVSLCGEEIGQLEV